MSRPAHAHDGNVPLLSIDDVSFEYRVRGEDPVRALDGVSLTVADGERVAVVGANGSGKSTLARLLNGLLLPTSGTVRVRGLDTRDQASRREIRRSVGMVFQNPDNQIVATIVEEDVAFGPENLGLASEEIRARVDAALALLGLEELRLRPPHLLSGGQKQRVAIAGALAMHPRALVLDEATALLDPVGRAEVRATVGQLHAEGTTIIQITHFMEEAATADRVLVMSEGRIAFEGPPRAVFARRAELRALRLDVPQVALLAERLALRLPGFPSVLLDVDEAAAAILARAQRRNGCRSWPSPTTDPTDQSHGSPPIGDLMAAAAPMDPTALIGVRGLWHTYLAGTPLAATALQGADFDLRAGEIAAIIGHTGSGKSTLVQHLNGLYRPQRGTVRVLGRDLADRSVDLRAVRREVGLVVQFPEHQVFEPTVGDDIAFAPRRLGCDRPEVRRRVRAAMEMVGLGFDQFKDRYTFGLSGGELRRVAIAGVLAAEPRVLVLDEPTAGLDPRGRTELRATLLRLRDEHGIAVVFVSHDMEEVAELAERVWVVADGRTALSGGVKEVFRRGDELRRLGLGVPQVTRLMYALRDAGLDVPSDVMTVDEAEAMLTERLG